LDRDLTVSSLTGMLFPLLENAPRRALMASAARSLGQPQAAVTLAEAVATLAQARIRKLGELA
ncbi:MAG: undecaprenyldiphospho-muramoylpentapeptide beta-N-acetylglucosaminyltransferase, partial [Ktedonobacterales bacterium]